MTSFSPHPGARQCFACPLHTNTLSNASTELLQCTQCPRWMCNDAGTCTIDPKLGVSTCRCDFGYDDDNRCKMPILYISVAVAVFIMVSLVLVTLVLLRKYRRKRRQEAEKERQLRTCHREISQLNSLWRIDPSELTILERIDDKSPGSFGEVSLALYRDMEVSGKTCRNCSIDCFDSLGWTLFFLFLVRKFC